MSQSRRTYPPDGVPLSSVSVSLTKLLHRPVVDCDRRPVGRVVDVVAEQSDGQALLVAGLVIARGDSPVFVPMKRLQVFPDAVVLDAVAGFDTPFERRAVDVLLAADVLGGRHIDMRLARLVRARDIELMLEHGRWVVAGVDVEWGGWWHHLPGRLNRHRARRSWDAIEPLTNTDAGPMVGWAGPGLGRLKPAQIADLLELASAPEQSDIIADLRTKPELEADVFEELDDNNTAELLAQRPDREIAVLLTRMSPDAAADAIATLPHDQFRRVLDLLPARRRDNVSMLLGYNPSAAGGLMGVDFLSVAPETPAEQALALVAGATGVEPQALNSVYLLDEHARLVGAVTLVRLVQAEPSTPIGELADPEPIRVNAHADAVDVAVLMCDHNLLNLPVVDPQDRMIGLITVDDVLDITIPTYWRRRTTNAPTPPPQPEPGPQAPPKVR